MSQRYFAVIAPGLEAALADELRAFRTRKRTVGEGGVSFEATGAGFYQVMHRSRLANRVYLRVDAFRARDPRELYRKTLRIDWSRLLRPTLPIEVEGVSRASRIFGSGAIESRVQDAIRDYWKGQGISSVPDEGSTPIRLLARLHEDQCELSLDAAGDLMHRRGWRLATGHAPLREHYAAALLQLCGWQPGIPLVDPACGSGTFLIEAARIALECPPRLWGSERYAFLRWANADLVRWDALVGASKGTDKGGVCGIWGNELDPQVAALARDNAERAGVSDTIHWCCGDALALTPPCDMPGLLICNPPYGERLSRFSQGKHPFERELIKHCQKAFQGWKMCLLLPADVHLPKVGSPWERVARFRNGGIPVCAWLCQL